MANKQGLAASFGNRMGGPMGGTGNMGAPGNGGRMDMAGGRGMAAGGQPGFATSGQPVTNGGNFGPVSGWTSAGGAFGPGTEGGTSGGPDDFGGGLPGNMGNYGGLPGMPNLGGMVNPFQNMGMGNPTATPGNALSRLRLMQNGAQPGQMPMGPPFGMGNMNTLTGPNGQVAQLPQPQFGGGGAVRTPNGGMMGIPGMM